MGGQCSKPSKLQVFSPPVLLGGRNNDTKSTLGKEDASLKIRSWRVTQAIGKRTVVNLANEPTHEANEQANQDVVARTEDLSIYRKPRAMGKSTRELVRASMRHDRLTALLEDDQIDTVLETMEHFEFAANHPVVTQGQVGNTFFVVEKGSLSVSVNGKVLNKLGEGSSFGGLALLYQCPRTASVTTSSTTRCWGASGATFKKVLQDNAQRQYVENRRFLDSIMIFNGLPEKLKDTIAAGVFPEVFDGGARVATQGEAAAAIYFVKSGDLRVCTGGRVTEIGELIGGQSRDMAVGECFGDDELLRGEEYSATVVADSRSELLCISAKYLREVLALLQGEDLGASLEKALLQSAIRRSRVISHLPPVQQEAVLQSISIQSYSADESIDDSLRFALVVGGQLQKQSSQKGGDIVVLKRGQWFEEDMLTETSPNREGQSGFAAGPDGCRLAVISHSGFAETLARTSSTAQWRTPCQAIDLARKKLVIRKAHAFHHLSHEQTDTVAKALASQVFSAGDKVVEQGEIGSAFYILAAGEVRVSISGKVIRNMGKNACFGERALIFDEPRSATIDVVSSTAEVWSLEKKVFSVIVQGKMLHQLCERIKLQDTNVTLKDLVHKKLIGAGACGSVRLVEHRTTGTRYALKRVQKKSGKIPEEVKRERQLLAENDHPFIMTYVKTLETNDSVYLLTEVITGGELHAAIRTIPTVLSRAQAQFYTGSLLLVLEELAGRGIVYRDLKPENVMLDAQGYMKLVDFGIAKKLREGNMRTFTIIGTPHYMAPEILQGRGYGLEVDVWSLGVLLYELVCGKLPFADDLDSPTDVCQAVLKETLMFPQRYRDAAGRSLISGLLRRRPTERLGSGVNGYEEIKGSAFFRTASSTIAAENSDDTANSETYSSEPPLFQKIIGRVIDPPVVPKTETYTDPSDLLHVELDDSVVLFQPKRNQR